MDSAGPVCGPDFSRKDFHVQPRWSSVLLLWRTCHWNLSRWSPTAAWASSEARQIWASHSKTLLGEPPVGFQSSALVLLGNLLPGQKSLVSHLVLSELRSWPRHGSPFRGQVAGVQWYEACQPHDTQTEPGEVLPCPCQHLLFLISLIITIVTSVRYLNVGLISISPMISMLSIFPYASWPSVCFTLKNTYSLKNKVNK